MQVTVTPLVLVVIASLNVMALISPASDPVLATSLHPRDLATVYTNCAMSNTVALTFDDGPYIYESGIIDTLNAAGIKATFFVNGNNYDCIYDAGPVQSLQKAYASGHMIGSHTWAHLDLSQQTWDKIHDEMWRVELAMTRILGVSPAFMRPPYGAYNDLVRLASSIRNQSLIIWDFDSGDSVGATVAESQQAYQALVNQHPDNILTLNHETHQTTADEVLPYAIQKLKDAGYKFATVAECLGRAPYHSVGAAGVRDSSWQC